jgi:hypothetical protein
MMAPNMPVTDPELRATFLTHYFPPEVGPAQLRLFELAKRLIQAGKTVTVLTGFSQLPHGREGAVVPAGRAAVRALRSLASM